MLFLDFFLNFYFVNHDEATFKCVPIEGLFTFLQFMVYFFSTFRDVQSGAENHLGIQ